MELLTLLLKVIALGSLLPCSEDIRRAFEHLFLLVGNLHRMNVVFLGDLLDRSFVFESLNGNPGLELGFVSSSFAFHY